MRYCVISLLLKFVMYYYENHTYGSSLLYMILDLALLLFFWVLSYTGYLLKLETRAKLHVGHLIHG